MKGTGMTNTPETRVDDARRDQVIAQLQEHAAAGRLTLDEFNDRMSRALAAKTESQLRPLVADLPSLPVRRRQPPKWVPVLVGLLVVVGLFAWGITATARRPAAAPAGVPSVVTATVTVTATPERQPTGAPATSVDPSTTPANPSSATPTAPTPRATAINLSARDDVAASNNSWRDGPATLAKTDYPSAILANMTVPDVWNGHFIYIDFAVPSGVTTFHAVAGQDDTSSTPDAVIRFAVLDEAGRTLWGTNMKCGQTAEINVNVSTVVRIRLIATLIHGVPETRSVRIVWAEPQFRS